MCNDIKKYASFLRSNKDLIWMFAGMIAAVFLYINERETTLLNIKDFKEFMRGAQLVQMQQTEALKEISVRLANVENKLK